jgi:hypothetical protein
MIPSTTRPISSSVYGYATTPASRDMTSTAPSFITTTPADHLFTASRTSDQTGQMAGFF